jgi:hypothetical protein
MKIEKELEAEIKSVVEKCLCKIPTWSFLFRQAIIQKLQLLAKL